MNLGYYDCDCKGATEERADEERRRIEVEEAEDARLRESLLVTSGISRRYRNARAVDDHRSLYITGPVGTGKTYRASAYALQAIDEGKSVRMVSSVDLLARIRESYRKGSDVSEQEIINAYTRCDVLIIDDLGKESPTPWALQTIYSIIDNRYRDESETIVTSNHSQPELARRLGGDEMAVALVSRLHELCDTVVMDGRDRRA